MNSNNTRQDALLSAISTIFENSQESSIYDTNSSSFNCQTLAYALDMLKVKKRVVSSDGSFYDLLEANNIYNRMVSTPTDLIRSNHPMLIVFAEDDGRAIALHRFLGKVYCFEPRIGKRINFNSNFRYKNYAYEIYPELPLPPSGFVKIFNFVFSTSILPLSIIVFFAFLIGILNLAVPYLTNILITRILPASDIKLILNTAIAVILIGLFSLISSTFSVIAITRFESTVNLRLETAVMGHLLRLPLTFFQKYGTIDLTRRISNISEMRKIVSNGLLSTFLNMIFSVIQLLIMFYYSAKLAIVATIFSIIVAVITVILLLIGASFEEPLEDNISKVQDMGFQAVVGMSQIRVSGTEPFIFNQWMIGVAKLSKLMRSSELINHSIGILGSSLNVMGSLLVAFTLWWLQNQSNTQNVPTKGIISLSPNELVAAYVMFTAAYTSFNGLFTSLLSQLAVSFTRLLVLWKRTSVVVQAVPEEKNTNGVTHEIIGKVLVENITMYYPGANEPVLKSINISIPEGSYTAITGVSGSGKTTLMRCLLRLVEYQVGTISVDQIDIQDLSLREYRRQIGVVLQNSPIPTGSIYDLVCAGRAFSRDHVWDVLNTVELTSDIKKMPMKLETFISEGSMTISGGQRQRLVLARALINKPKLIFLDEATSALDSPTQAAITKILENLGVTRIVIAHRISTIQSADQIAVIASGKISELGTYKELKKNIFGYFKNGNDKCTT